MAVEDPVKYKSINWYDYTIQIFYKEYVVFHYYVNVATVIVALLHDSVGILKLVVFLWFCRRFKDVANPVGKPELKKFKNLV